MCDKLGNGATYDGEILHAVSCGACVTHGLGVMSAGRWDVCAAAHLADKHRWRLTDGRGRSVSGR